MSISEALRSQQAPCSNRFLEFVKANPPAPCISAEEQARRNRAERMREHAERVDRAFIPGRYRFATVSTCVAEAEAYAQEIIDGSTRNLVIAGAANAGKTYMACAILRRVLQDRQMSCLFSTMPDILQAFRSGYGNKEREDSFVARYSRVALLVIDDMGKEYPNKWTLPVIWSIINNRYSAQLPTIYTTQYDREGLAQRFVDGGADDEMAQSIVRRILQNDEAMLARAVNPSA